MEARLGPWGWGIRSEAVLIILFAVSPTTVAGNQIRQVLWSERDHKHTIPERGPKKKKKRRVI